MSKKDWYEKIAKILEEKGREICSDNGCSEDNHKCESMAYFDFDGQLGAYRIFDICLPDYMPRRADSYVCMPWIGDGEELRKQLEENDERE